MTGIIENLGLSITNLSLEDKKSTDKSTDKSTNNIQDTQDELTTNKEKKIEKSNNEEDILTIFKNTISNNEYVNRKRNIGGKSINSLSYLSDKDLTQSQCIKLGIAMEKVLSDLISEQTDYKDIRPKNKKGEPEKDLLFMNKDNTEIIYAECKSNLELDTEKSKSTSTKVEFIKNKLTEQYKKNEEDNICIKANLLCLRYLSKEDMPSFLIKKYPTNVNLVGLNDYLKLFNLDYKIKDYVGLKIIINFLVEKMFKEEQNKDN
jgi:hypothetical protein